MFTPSQNIPKQRTIHPAKLSKCATAIGSPSPPWSPEKSLVAWGDAAGVGVPDAFQERSLWKDGFGDGRIGEGMISDWILADGSFFNYMKLNLKSVHLPSADGRVSLTGSRSCWSMDILPRNRRDVISTSWDAWKYGIFWDLQDACVSGVALASLLRIVWASSEIPPVNISRISAIFSLHVFPSKFPSSEDMFAEICGSTA